MAKKAQGAQGENERRAGLKRGADAVNASSSVQNRIANSAAPQGPAGPQGLAGALMDSIAPAASLDTLVELNIPYGKPKPVADALRELAAQANCPIEISAAVPQGQPFRIQGRISGKSLGEALNLITQTARLEWRLLSDRIAIYPMPDFQVFYGDSTVPKATFGLQNAAPQPAAKAKPGGK